MYSQFFIRKRSGTYAETLEAFGVAILVNEILERSAVGGRKITIEDKGLQYLVTTNRSITNEMLDNLGYFQIIKFLIKDNNTVVPSGIAQSECFDYPSQKAEHDHYKGLYDKIEKDNALSSEHKRKARKELAERKISEFGVKTDVEYDVYRELIKNPYASFIKLYSNLSENQNRFPGLVREVLRYYAELPITDREYKLTEEKPTAQQLLNPNQGKGLNRNKADSASMGNLNGSWISETMKISGALQMMTVQYLKVGSGYDLKVYVPEFCNIRLSEGLRLIIEFKRHLKGASPIKLDVLNLLNLIIKFIERTPEYNKGKVKNTIRGFHSVYQKDLGQNKAVANIAFVSTPDFVAYNNKEEGREWITILEEQRNIIASIEEQGDSIQGLQNYRSFLGSSGTTALQYFAHFNYWYAGYLMQAIDREKYYVKPFKTEILTKFYTYMDSRLSEIIHNEGFQSVAQAIRKSTVTLQYTPKESRRFGIRYGLAQQLQNKSKSKVDLATFIGEFVGTYNAETARSAEKNNGQAFRANVKDTELLQFYELLDNFPPRLIGALLTSYGFALTKKETPPEAVANGEDTEIETIN